MKKSLLTLITFALVLVNLVLTGVMALTIVPEVGSVNALIDKISAAIDLDYQAGNEKTGGTNFDINSSTPHELADTLTINLKRGEDGEDHFAVLGINLMLNNNSTAFATFGESIASYESTIRATINSIVGGHTLDEIRNDTEGVQTEIRDALNSLFGSDLISQVGFSSATYQ